MPALSAPPPATRSDFSPALLGWYRAARRVLPWRERQGDAYAVWISEIMLQQTTVAAVIGFYNRWMERFPTLESLAEADPDEVLRYWAGLGYYSRARNIKRAAEMVVLNHGGILPNTVDELLRLPGIGRYTAGAVASIAYEVDAPIVDANVVRVLCRVDGLQSEKASTDSALQVKLWERAEALIPPGEAREFNQAMMELGALVCSPRAPACDRCPVASWCVARASGAPESYPSVSRAKEWRTARHAAAAVFSQGKFLIVKRPADALHWAGFWELPRAVASEGESLPECAARALRETVGLDAVIGADFGTVNHTVTVTKIALSGFQAILTRLEQSPQRRQAQDFAWIGFDDLQEYAISSPHRKLISRLRASSAQTCLGF